MLHAQSRPSGVGRFWAEVGLGGARQAPRCRDCVRTRAIAGPILAGAVGVTLPQGFGVSLLARAFQEFSFEYSQGSRYVVALGQYTPPRLKPLTLNAGAGWGRHRGDGTPYTNDDEGAALVVGAALRLPARSRFAASITADATQSISGTTTYRPRLLSVGLALSLASAPAD